MKHKKKEREESLNDESLKKLRRKRKKVKREKKHKKKKKKEKRCKSSSSSNSTESEGEVWVEKTAVDCKTAAEYNNVSSSTHEEKLERDEWMNLSIFSCVSESGRQRDKSEAKKKNADISTLYEPGQSDRELNPYWKNDGSGLPQADTNEPTESNLDATWLKKSLQRAKEQAAEEGKSLEEIAAERWGSLETIESMIAQAEAGSRNRDRDAENRSTYDNHSNYKYKERYRSRYRRQQSYKSRESSTHHDRNRSRSRSRERSDKYSTYNKYNEFSFGLQQKKSYKKPSNSDDYSTYSSHKSGSSRARNWQKEEVKEKNLMQQAESSTSIKDVDAEVTSTKMNTDDQKSKVVTEEELNKLGARVIKAEIMGDEELAAQLRVELEEARKYVVKGSAARAWKEREETVILTKTDSKGVTRPLAPRSQYGQSAESRNRRKPAETHVSGERVRYYADDDKYSLQQMFQREKGRSANEDDAMFTKLAAKNMDMDDSFEQHIAHAESDEKLDKKDRMSAINEHKRMSKSLDNCWWCIDSNKMLKYMIVAMDSNVCLSLPTHVSLTKGHCILTPIEHIPCQLLLDEDVWETLKAYKKALTKMFMDQDKCPVFFEIYKNRHKFPHMRLECVPLPKEFGDSAPMYFKKALMECETEWSVNKKVIDISNKDIRQAVPKGLAYFMVEIGTENGFAHVIEDERLFPKNFAEEIIGGMLDLDHNLWRRPNRENFDQQTEKVYEFTEIWKQYSKLIPNNE